MEDFSFFIFYCPHSVDSVQLNIDWVEFRDNSVNYFVKPIIPS